MRTPLIIAAILLATSSVNAQLATPTWGLLIPAAGAVQGANGTFFRSDITLTNFRKSPQMIQIQWLPQDLASVASGIDNPIITTMDANATIASEDFVTQVLHQQGLGAILITGWRPNLTVDGNALLYATARIWTPQPGSSGTVSQSFPVIPMTTIVPPPPSNVEGTRQILGQRIDAHYRTNVGIVNLDTLHTQTFIVVQSSDIPSFVPLQSEIEVGPSQMVQVPLANIPAANLVVYVNSKPLPGNVAGRWDRVWAAYASSVDNVTGGAWSNSAIQPAPHAISPVALLRSGTWGGANVNVAVSSDEAVFTTTGCVRGHMIRPMIDADGNFIIDSAMEPLSGPPMPPYIWPVAVVVGRVSGDAMTWTATYANGTVLGPFYATYGASGPTFIPCPV